MSHYHFLAFSTFLQEKAHLLCSFEGYNDIGRMSGRWYDDMMIWYDDMMIWWYDDIIIFSRFRILYRYLFIIIWTSVPGNNCGSPPAFPNCYSFEKGIIGKILLFDWEIRSNHNFVDLHCTSERAILLLLRYFCALAATDIATILFSKFNNSVSKMLLPNHCYDFRTKKKFQNFKLERFWNVW